jgi:hypothetical protein
VEQDCNQLTSIGINLVCEILNAGTTTQTQHGVAIAAWNNSAT